MQDIQMVENRINKAFYADLFMMMTNSDRRQITAREIDEKAQGATFSVRPSSGEFMSRLLNPLIDRTFAIMARAGSSTADPEELAGMQRFALSTLASWQWRKNKSAQPRSNDRRCLSATWQADPGVLDKIDFDQAVDEFTSMVGIDPRIIRDEEVVAQIRQQRQQMQQAQQMAELAKTASEAGRNMGQTPISNDAEENERNALQGALGL